MGEVRRLLLRLGWTAAEIDRMSPAQARWLAALVAGAEED